LNNTALNLKDLGLGNARLVPSWARKAARGGSAKEWHRPKVQVIVTVDRAQKNFSSFCL